MTKTEYRNYIASAKWQQRRKEFLNLEGEKCARCEMPRWLAEIAYDQDLHVHHLSYANIGCEKDEDLEALCRRCHQVETFGRSDVREIKAFDCSICCSPHWNSRADCCQVCLTIIRDGIFPPQFEAGESQHLLGRICNDVGFYIGAKDKELTDAIKRLEIFYARGVNYRRQVSGRSC